MSEVTENPGKQQGIIGFVLALVALLLGGTIMGWLYMATFSKIVALLAFALPVAAIIISVKGMNASKAAGQKNGLGLTGMIIGIVAAVWLIMVFMTLAAFGGMVEAAASGDLENALEGLQQLENLSH